MQAVANEIYCHLQHSGLWLTAWKFILLFRCLNADEIELNRLSIWQFSEREYLKKTAGDNYLSNMLILTVNIYLTNWNGISPILLVLLNCWKGKSNLHAFSLMYFQEFLFYLWVLSVRYLMLDDSFALLFRQRSIRISIYVFDVNHFVILQRKLKSLGRLHERYQVYSLWPISI